MSTSSSAVETGGLGDLGESPKSALQRAKEKLLEKKPPELKLPPQKRADMSRRDLLNNCGAGVLCRYTSYSLGNINFTSPSEFDGPGFWRTMSLPDCNCARVAVLTAPRLAMWPF